MPAGLRVIGSHSFVQIDETYRNLMLKTKSTFTCSTTSANPNANHYFGTVTVTANAFPVLAVRGAGKVGFAGFLKSGNDYTFYYASSNSGDVITYYHFDVPNPSDTSNYLEIRDASGNRVFNALQKSMRVVDLVGPGIGSVTYTSGRVYASIQSSSGFSDQETLPAGKGSGTYRAWQCCARWISNYEVVFGGTTFVNGLGIENLNVGTQNLNRFQYDTNKFVVVDVTGY